MKQDTKTRLARQLAEAHAVHGVAVHDLRLMTHTPTALAEFAVAVCPKKAESDREGHGSGRAHLGVRSCFGRSITAGQVLSREHEVVRPA
jgi:hypothetical protein